MMTTYTKRFTREDEATKFWESIGYSYKGGRVITNELEYCKDGTFEVVTVIEK